MFILFRRVSPYMEWDPLFLGLFSNPSRAEEARAAYAAAMQHNDPFREQAYRKPDLSKDVIVEPIDDHRSARDASMAFLVTRHLEGMGQVHRWYLAVYSTLEDAGKRAAAEAAEESVVAEYISIEEIVVDDTRYFTMSPFRNFSGGLWLGKQPGDT